ncbi:hypothetical protein ACFU99_07730 [Streptomyces sp. NPDC057654]|uniref:hypothetical protein n=1 Tax=Streptomyces sp. NPDC057654 TaxID=3346196 RepID=UPI00368BEBE1
MNPNKLTRFSHRHYGDAVGAVATLAMVVTLFVMPQHNGVTTAVTWAVFAVIVVAAFIQIKHGRGPGCEQCFQEMPLNVSEEGERRRRWRWSLASFHYVYGTNFRANAVTLAFFGTCLLGYEDLYRLIGIDGAGFIARLFATFSFLFIVGSNWLIRTHNRLQPWCPQCPHGGHGKGRTVMFPAPQGDHPVPA